MRIGTSLHPGPLARLGFHPDRHAGSTFGFHFSSSTQWGKVGFLKGYSQVQLWVRMYEVFMADARDMQVFRRCGAVVIEQFFLTGTEKATIGSNPRLSQRPGTPLTSLYVYRL